MQKETENKTLMQLEKEIWTSEQRLQELREEYLARTGHMPTRKLNDSSWKWSIFMVLGFAFISMVVYLLGIRHTGSESGLGIPSFFFETEIAYFAILSFYAILMVLMVQSKKLSGYQSMALILGFWCAHWLIYDWGWYAYTFGVGEIADPSTFWLSYAGQSFLIPQPTMWFFLLLAILGGIMAFYTFSVPRCRKHLIPPMIWLYSVYFNASLCEIMGLSETSIIIVACILAAFSFGLMGFFTFQRLKRGRPNWLTNIGSSGELLLNRKWMTDLLGIPFVFAMVGMLVTMHLFLTINPALGLFLGMIPWFFIPIYYILINSTGVAKVRGLTKILIVSVLTALFVAFVILMSVLPIDTYF
ncbi:MAG TPA: hypothetical protein VMV49_06885 [Candidatus Deferrimicrobium sp.]|nr:hypothetical protein [Candidatus Deferrimicrobium sp.]